MTPADQHQYQYPANIWNDPRTGSPKAAGQACGIRRPAAELTQAQAQPLSLDEEGSRAKRTSSLSMQLDKAWTAVACAPARYPASAGAAAAGVPASAAAAVLAACAAARLTAPAPLTASAKLRAVAAMKEVVLPARRGGLVRVLRQGQVPDTLGTVQLLQDRQMQDRRPRRLPAATEGSAAGAAGAAAAAPPEHKALARATSGGLRGTRLRPYHKWDRNSCPK